MSLRHDARRVAQLISLEGSAYVLGLLSLAAVNLADVVAPVFLAAAIDLTRTALDGTPTRTPPVLQWLGIDAAALSVATATTVFLLLQLAANVFRYPMLMNIAVPSHRIGQRTRNAIIQHMLSLSRPFYDRSRTGDLMSLVTNDVTAQRMMLGPGVLVGADAFIIVSFVVTLLFTLSPSLTLMAMIPLPLIALVTNRLSLAEFKRFEAVQEDLGRLTERARESFAGIRVVQGYAREDFDRARFAEASERHLHKNLALARVRALFAPSLDLMLGLATVIVLVKGGTAVAEGTLTLGTFVAFLFLFGFLSGPMVGFGWSVSLFQRGRASMRRIDRFLAEPVEITDAPAASEAQPGRLEVRDLTFAYTTAAPPVVNDEGVESEVPSGPPRGEVLHGVSFVVEPGQRVGIVGAVGSGKSTLVQLVARLYEPPPGSILLDGVDIRLLSQRSLRQQVVVAPQETFLFSDTLERNISVVGNTASADVDRCVELAGLGPDIAALPAGLQTLVGERGVNLSGGQRQRVSIARAIAADPSLLVLDDCLSAVDARTEARVLENLRAVFAGRSGIIVSHRVAAVRDCDAIVVLDDGRVAERGTHTELVEADGLYAQMARAQGDVHTQEAP